MATIAGKEYFIGKINAMDQFMMVKKLAPAIAVIEPIVAARNEGKTVTVLVAMMFAKLSDADAKDVMATCLSVAKVKQGDAWASVMANGALMFHDLEVDEIMQICTAAIIENLGGFFKDALASLENGAAEV